VMLTPAFPATEEDSCWLPPLQNFVKAIALRNPGLDVHVVAFQYPYKKGSYVWHGVQVHALAGKNRRFPIRFATWLRAAFVVRWLIRRHRVIALHSHWLAECSYVGSWISRTSRIKHIATIHGQDALATNPYLKRLAFETMTITAVSEKAADAF